MLEAVELRTTIERKAARLPRYVVVPAPCIAAWELVGTTFVEAWLDGHSLGRRTLKRWDDERWFVELTQPHCDAAHVDTGDEALLRMRLASAEPAVEITRLIVEHAAARAAWEALTASQQRALDDHVATAKVAATRWKRAALGLGVNVPVPPDLKVRRRARPEDALRVEIQTVPVAEGDPRTPARGFDLLADWFAKEILCDAWKEAIELDGGDPATAGPPPELRTRREVWEQFLESELKRRR